MTYRSLAVVLLIMAATDAKQPPIAAQTAVGTAFTYQGRLTDAGSTANGIYDFQFTLYDAPSAGSPVGGLVSQEEVAVSGGVFTVLVDFGAAAFTGEARWLEVAVRPGVSGGAYATIAPRQRLSPTPYAIDALQFGGKPPGDYALQSSVDDLEADIGALETQLAAVEDQLAGVPTFAFLDAALASTAKLADTQTFTGANTFTGVTTLSNAANALSGVVTFADTTAACDTSLAGTARWTSASKELELCDGSQWTRMAPMPSWGRTASSSVNVGCWGGSPSTYVSTGVTATYTNTAAGRPLTVTARISNVSTTGAAGASFRVFVVDNSSEVGRTRVLMPTGNSTSIEFNLFHPGFGGGSMPTFRLECAADAAGPQIVNATVELLIREM